jgi:hypothetical protein
MWWIGLAIVAFTGIFNKQLGYTDRWMIRVGIVPDNRWSAFIMLGVGVGIAVVPCGSKWGWLVAAGYILVLWWERRPQSPASVKEIVTKKQDVTINLEWPNGKGFTQCSPDFYHNSLESFKPTSSSPEDY